MLYSLARLRLILFAAALPLVVYWFEARPTRLPGLKDFACKVQASLLPSHVWLLQAREGILQIARFMCPEPRPEQFEQSAAQLMAAVMLRYFLSVRTKPLKRMRSQMSLKGTALSRSRFSVHWRQICPGQRRKRRTRRISRLQ